MQYLGLYSIIFQMDQISELPSGFSEVRHTDQVIALTQAEIPWFGRNEEIIPLVRVNVRGGGNFYLGSAIREKRLTQAANQLDEHRSRITNNLLYSHLPDFIVKGYNPAVTLVDDARSEKPIFYVGNKGGQRVYFMRLDKLQGIPVIIRMAVCDKSMEDVVLGVMTTNSHKRIKHVSRL